VKVKYFAWCANGRQDRGNDRAAGGRSHLEDLMAGWRGAMRLRPCLRDPARDPRAIDHAHVNRYHDRRRPRDCVFPADDRRLILSWLPPSPSASRKRFRDRAGDRALTKGRTDIGAVVSFSGICRGSEAARPSRR